jgi:FkbM family methyltransferase
MMPTNRESHPGRVVEVDLDRLERTLTIEVHPDHDEYISEELVAFGRWEPFETELVLRLLPADGLLADCGANIGWYSLVAAAAGHSVIAAEPEPGNLELLRRNIDRNGLGDHIEVHACALAGRQGIGQLALSPSNQGDHRLSAGQERDSIGIELQRLDQIVGDRSVDVMKVDTQGSEVNVLRGCTDFFEQASFMGSLSMILEFWPFGLQQCGSSAEELIGLLTPLVGVTHECYLISEDDRSLQPVALTDLASLAQRGDYSVDAGGHTNLLVMPTNRLHDIADLVTGTEVSSDDPHEAVVRAQLARLLDAERHVYSQNGEDGIISELARLTGCPRVMVELGAGNGEECNSRFPREQGWNVVAIDGDPENSTWVREAFIDSESIASILRQSEVNGPIGVLSIDLDGNDFWILMSVPDEFLPTVLVMEYNATLGPVEPLTVSYRRRRMWDHSNHFGASLPALAMLAAHRNFELVYCESQGANAFFVARDALEASGLHPIPVTCAYRPPKYGQLSSVGEFRGHQPSTRRLVHVARIEDAQRSLQLATGRGPAAWVRRRIESIRVTDWWRLGPVWIRNRVRSVGNLRPAK